jgi:hypothetical protein
MWLAPFLVIPVSYLTYREKKYRSTRFWIYGIILVTAFLSDLTSVSSTVDQIDTMLTLAVAIIIGELFWKLIHIKNKVMRTFFIICSLIAFTMMFKNWILSGPKNSDFKWRSPIADSYEGKMHHYTVKESKKNDKNRIVRTYELQKKISFFPLEKNVRSYRVPLGYSNSEFNFKWSDTSKGVRLDLVSDGDIIWTLGEGF